DLLQHPDAFLDREQAALAFVDQHGHDDLVEQPGRAADDVEMAVGHRVEGTGADGASHGARRYLPDACRTAFRAVCSTVSPYRRSRTAASGTGQGNASPRPRSTTTTASTVSHPCACATASQPATSAS